MGSRDAGVALQEAIELRASAPIDEAYDDWKQADAAARRLERELSDTWRRYERGVGAPPNKGLLRDVAWQRHAAGEKLSHVIDLLHASGHIQPPARSAGQRASA